MKLRFFLKSFDQALIKQALDEITPILANINCEVRGCVALPMKIKRFCVIRSPHIDKDSREHFEIRIYKQFFDFSVDNPENLNLLFKANLPAGLSCFLKILEN
jgi:small subunit ribosomal protein S10